MQNSTLIKQNIHKLVSYHRKTIMNEVVQTGILREAFNSNRLPKNLTEEQFLFMVIEGLAKDSDFILENYKILTHPNLTPEILNEFRGIGKVIKAIPGIIKGIPGVLDDIYKWGKSVFKWVWKKVGDTWEWVWSGPPGSTPDVPKPTKPGRIPDSIDDPLDFDPTKQIGPHDTHDGFPDDDYELPGTPWDGQDQTLPNIFDNPPDPNQWLNPLRPDGTVGESMSKFNRNMRHLMESNRQIDQNLLHSMLNQVNESKYLLELAIQRNQVNRIIDRI